MKAFETFLLNFAKAVVADAPYIAPIFIHSQQGVAIFNASDALSGAFLQEFSPAPTAPATTVKP
jgi:hypothetical protein